MGNTIQPTAAKDYQVVNTTTADLEPVYRLFEEAIAYINKNNYVGWTTYDKTFLNDDIRNKLQFKIVQNNQILCVFSICRSDALIWGSREKGDAVYLHRIAVNPKYKGQKQFQKVLDWATIFARNNRLHFIRMDTWAENPAIIKYYQTFGFKQVDTFTTPNTPNLPVQHRMLKVALLELTLLKDVL